MWQQIAGSVLLSLTIVIVGVGIPVWVWLREDPDV